METFKVTRFAGTGEEGEINGHRLSSSFSVLRGICMDKEGTLYVADGGTRTIRKILGDQVTNLITKDEVILDYPCGVCLGKDGNLYFTDRTKHVVCKVIDGITTVLAGIPSEQGNEDGAQGTLSFPTGIVEGEEGEFFVACSGPGSIRKVSKDGSLSTLCTGLAAPYGITKDSSGNLFVAEFGGHCVQRVDSNGVVTPVVPKGELEDPIGVVFDLFGNLLVCEYNTGNMKRISPGGKVSTLSLVDQLGQPYNFNRPIDMAVDATGVYVTEQNKHVITFISMPQEWSTSLHSHFPSETKKQIKTLVMLTMKKGHSNSHMWKLPKDIWLIVIRFVASQ